MMVDQSHFSDSRSDKRVFRVPTFCFGLLEGTKRVAYYGAFAGYEEALPLSQKGGRDLGPIGLSRPGRVNDESQPSGGGP